MQDQGNSVPHGFCRCGCGELAPIAKQTITARGWVKGQPVKYVRGHSMKGRKLGPYGAGRRANISTGIKKRHAEEPDLARRMSEQRKGIPRPPEVVEKVRKALTGRKLSDEHRAALSVAQRNREVTPKMRAAWKRGRAEAHPNWKGDEASYHWKHQWLGKWHPKSGICERCRKNVGTEGYTGTEWAFLHHPEPHTRNPDDYIELCRKCHRRMDFDDRVERRARELLAERQECDSSLAPTQSLA